MKKTLETIVADLLKGMDEWQVHNVLAEAIRRDNMKMAVVVAKYIKANF